jgi:hypothetical protein
MIEYYNILHYLTHFRVDRQYPYNFQSIEGILPTGKVTLDSENKTLHEKSLRFLALDTEDNIIIPINSRRYDTVDLLEVKIISSNNIDPEQIQLGLHESLQNQPLLNLNPDTTNTISAGSHTTLFFRINTGQAMDSNSKKLSHIQGLSIHFNQAISTIFITDIVFRTNDYLYTLEDLEHSLIDGEDYVKQNVGMDTIPTELNNLKYRAAAAFAWLIRWEQEAKVMDTGSKESKNYADRLLGMVDRAIKKYLEPPTIDETESDDYINEALVGSTDSTW